MAKLYTVHHWERIFEGSKSKTYKNKTSCQLPTKHGLSYKRLVKSKDGAAVFGAWCALIQVLSRHPAPRRGYCTDNGKANGSPYSPDDLELLTDIPSVYFKKMFELCSSQVIDWMDVRSLKDTTGDCEGTILPLDSDLDLDLDKDLDSVIEEDFLELIRSHYNDVRGQMPKCIKLGSTRKGQIQARLNEVGIDELKRIITSCVDMPLLQGSNDRGWKADLEWITKESNFVKIQEGKYLESQPTAKVYSKSVVPDFVN